MTGKHLYRKSNNDDNMANYMRKILQTYSTHIVAIRRAFLFMFSAFKVPHLKDYPLY